MTEEIIELLPSSDLKEKIRETDYHFTEGQLLQIIYQYAPSFEERLDLLERFSKVSSPDISELAKVFIQTQQNNFKKFVEKSDGFVYELHIKETPDSADECYICSSYESALKCIDLFYEEYADIGAEETDETRYKIIKRKVFSGSDKFEEDNFAECLLGANKTVVKLEDYENEADCELAVLCSECDRICAWRADELLFPCFDYDRAIIKYHDHAGKEHFGVSLCDENDCDGIVDCLYVIPLDSYAISHHDFGNDFNAHQHIELLLLKLRQLMI